MVTWYVKIYEKRYEKCESSKIEFLEGEAADRYADKLRGKGMRAEVWRHWVPGDFVDGPMERFQDYSKGKTGGWFRQLLGLQ